MVHYIKIGQKVILTIFVLFALSGCQLNIDEFIDKVKVGGEEASEKYKAVSKESEEGVLDYRNTDKQWDVEGEFDDKKGKTFEWLKENSSKFGASLKSIYNEWSPELRKRLRESVERLDVLIGEYTNKTEEPENFVE